MNVTGGLSMNKILTTGIIVVIVLAILAFTPAGKYFGIQKPAA